MIFGNRSFLQHSFSGVKRRRKPHNYNVVTISVGIWNEGKRKRVKIIWILNCKRFGVDSQVKKTDIAGAG